MQLGFVSAILPELSLEEVLAFAAETGFDSVEVMCWPIEPASRRYAGVTHIDVTDFSETQADKCRAAMAKHGVAISALGYYPNPLSTDPEEASAAIRHLRKVIAASARIGVHAVNTFVGRDRTRTVDQNWSRFLVVWPDIVLFAEEHHVRIGIENCPMYFSEDEWPAGNNLAVSPAIWRRIFDAIPSESLGLNYDPSHFVWQQMDYFKPVREFASRIFHVHAKDVRIDRNRLDDVGTLAVPLAYHQPKLPGLGEIDWGRFISELGSAAYQGHIAIEVEDRAYEHSLDARFAALRQSYRFLRNYV